MSIKFSREPRIFHRKVFTFGKGGRDGGSRVGEEGQPCIFAYFPKIPMKLRTIWDARVDPSIFNTIHFIPALRADDADETENGTNGGDEAQKIDPLTGSIIPAERNLSRDLFAYGYDKTVRPAKTAKDIVNITMDLLLLRVVAMVSGDICAGI